MSNLRRTYLTTLLALLCFLGSGPLAADPDNWQTWEARTATGTDFHSQMLDGKVVVVSVWGSWSPACRKQMPVLDGIQDSLAKEPFQVLAFSLDKSQEIHQQFVADNRIRVPSIYARTGDGLKVVRMLQRGAGTLEAVPTVLIYDKKGKLAHRLVGFFNRQQLEELITPLLSP